MQFNLKKLKVNFFMTVLLKYLSKTLPFTKINGASMLKRVHQELAK